MRIRIAVLTALLLLGAGVMPVVHAATAAYVAPTCALKAITKRHPSECGWTGVKLDSPRTEATIASPDVTVGCHPTTTAECEDTKVLVPQGANPSSLYVKVAWEHPIWSVLMYVIDPTGKVHGGGALGCDDSSYEKGCGNQTTLPFDELVVVDPMPGTWTIRVAAVNIHGEPYVGTVSLVQGHPTQYVRETLAQLTAHLTRHEPVNIVFAGWTPTADDLAQMKDALTSEFMPAVSEKALCDGLDSGDLPGAGLVQNETNHCTATADPSDPNYSASGSVPYFEPLRYLIDYHFLAASDTWTKDLFAAAQAATTQDHAFFGGHIPLTGETAPFKASYLQLYNKQSGKYRGTSAQVDTTNHVDEINGLTVEDWIQNHRFDQKYKTAFTDLGTGAKQSGAFINPDPTAVRDPFWDGNGTKPVNVDVDPAGVNSGVTFFLLDTFTPSYASSYFRTNRYHYWWTGDDVKDPDTNQAAFADNGRGWGGRYRFHILDLGAAPTTYERADWLTQTVAADGGSAAFDPPIWDYQHNPNWNGSKAPGALQAGGNTLGSVMGWEVTQGLTFKYIGPYLYRPIPNDVYILATNGIVDHYSLPSEGDFYSVDAGKLAQNDVAVHALSSAAPYATFQLGPNKDVVLGCAANRAVIVGNPNGVSLTAGLVKLVPNPKCKSPDAFQQAIEDGKGNGSGALITVNGATVPDFAVNQDYIRDYIDHHRADYAPLYDGAFTVPVVNIMFEHSYVVALPLVVGGIAENVNGGEGWGQIDNVNDQFVNLQAINCAKSSPVAPGCHGVPDVFGHDNSGLTYTMEHESAHFLGLNHPHDGATSVGKSADGSWHYYYDMLKWTYDISASPTTYAGSYAPYETIDQERLMAGHAAEYLRQAQDWLTDAYFTDGAAGKLQPSKATLDRVKLAKADIAQATTLFQAGDYLHAQYAMHNAALHAQGITQAAVAPHRMSLADAASNTNAIFKINPQKAFHTVVPVSPSDPPAWTGPPNAGGATATAASTAAPTTRRTLTAQISFCHIRWN